MPDILQELESIPGARDITILPNGGFSMLIGGFGFNRIGDMFKVIRVPEKKQMSHLDGQLFSADARDMTALAERAKAHFSTPDIRRRVMSVIHAMKCGYT